MRGPRSLGVGARRSAPALTLLTVAGSATSAAASAWPACCWDARGDGSGSSSPPARSAADPLSRRARETGGGGAGGGTCAACTPLRVPHTPLFAPSCVAAIACGGVGCGAAARRSRRVAGGGRPLLYAPPARAPSKRCERWCCDRWQCASAGAMARCAPGRCVKAWPRAAPKHSSVHSKPTLSPHNYAQVHYAGSGGTPAHKVQRPSAWRPPPRSRWSPRRPGARLGERREYRGA